MSPNALRYYERVGLIDPVRRNAAGRRLYDENAIARIVFVTRMRATGMSIRTLRKYMDLARAGEHTADRRREILQEHRARLRAQREEIEACLEIIDRKMLTGYGLVAARTSHGRAS